MSTALLPALVASVLLAQQPRDVRPAMKLGTAVLSGVVVSEETASRPLKRVNIGVLSMDDAQVRLMMTDDAGRFVVPALPAGRYHVTASKPPYVDSVYGARLPGRPGTAIVLKDGERRSDLVLKLLPGGAITGVVTDEFGQPAVGVRVELLEPRRPAGEAMITSVMTMLSGMLLPGQTTDDRGVYRFSGLPPGQYIVAATPVDLAGGNARALTEEDVQTATREATTTPRPPSTPTSTRAPTSTVINQEQRPERPMQTSGMPFMNMPPVPGPGNAGPARGPTVGYAPVYYPGTTSASEAAPITIGPGDERRDVDIVARPVPTTRIEGMVFGPDGQPAPLISIRIRAEDRIETIATAFLSMSMGVQTRPDGYFALNGIAPGRYTIQARTMARPALPGVPGAPPPASPPALWASAEITADGQPITGLTLTLQPGMTISGRVIFDGGKEPPNGVSSVSIAAVPGRDAGILPIAGGSTRPAADGTFTITGLIPGRYRLNGTVTENLVPIFWRDVSVVSDGRDVSDLPFEIRPGQSVTGVVMTVSDKQQELSGVLQDASGRPASEYTMILFPANRAYWLPDSRRILIGRPGTDGHFAFKGPLGPPPGDYLLAAVTDLRPDEQYDRAFLDLLAKESVKVTIGPGEIKTQDVRLVK
ncbi:MAG TPA: carboxypeptidase-like regulatory domain-containing protein [Vicinamibacterales bacterium]|nr:carboxypeptidase-like regulatory domain-containing protein [Vicinamibacterales bacterium]